MERSALQTLFVLGALLIFAPSSFAQAPDPSTILGLIDQYYAIPSGLVKIRSSQESTLKSSGVTETTSVLYVSDQKAVDRIFLCTKDEKRGVENSGVIFAGGTTFWIDERGLLAQTSYVSAPTDLPATCLSDALAFRSNLARLFEVTEILPKTTGAERYEIALVVRKNPNYGDQTARYPTALLEIVKSGQVFLPVRLRLFDNQRPGEVVVGQLTWAGWRKIKTNLIPTRVAIRVGALPYSYHRGKLDFKEETLLVNVHSFEHIADSPLWFDPVRNLGPDRTYSTY